MFTLHHINHVILGRYFLLLYFKNVRMTTELALPEGLCIAELYFHLEVRLGKIFFPKNFRVFIEDSLAA